MPVTSSAAERSSPAAPSPLHTRPAAAGGRRADPAYAATLFGIVVLTFVIHEAGHYLTGRLLGYEMAATLNSVTPLGDGYRSPLHAGLVDLGGVAVTLLQAIVAVAVIRRGGGLVAYAALFAAFTMRLLAAGVSVFHPNDEARLSLMLGLNQWIVPALVVAGLALMLAHAHRRLGLHWSVNVWSWIVASVGVTAVVGLDRLLFG